MSKITYNHERIFPNLYVLRNDPTLKEELEFVYSIVDHQDKAKKVIRYAQARERLYIDLRPSIPDEPLLEDEELDDDAELREAMKPSSQWEEELQREVQAARKALEKMGVAVDPIDRLRINGTTLEESIKELRKERLQKELEADTEQVEVSGDVSQQEMAAVKSNRNTLIL